MFSSAIRTSALPGVVVALVAIAVPSAAQVTGVSETPLRAVGSDAARRQSSPPATQTSYYANVLPAQSGDGSLDRIDAIPGFQFVTIKVIASVAPAVFAGPQDISGGQASGGLGALHHLTMHVTIRPLDTAGQPIALTRPDPIVLATLEISPSEPAFSDRVGNTAAAIATATTDVTTALKPISRILQSFQSSYHRRPAATQVSYMTGQNAFGWRWYESPGATIEGLHNANALLQISTDVKSVRVTVDLVADWRAFGLWSKSFDFTYVLPRPPG